MLPILSLTPDQMTKTPSASPISPPHNSELFSLNFATLWSGISCLGSSAYSERSPDAAQREAVRCWSGVHVGLPALRSSAKRAAPRPGPVRTTLVRFLRQAERVDHLAFAIGALDDEFLVVFGILVVRNHVVFG